MLWRFYLYFFLPLEDELLIKKLGDNNFYVREQAHKELMQRMDNDPSLYIKLKIRNEEKDPEIRWRINFILARYENRLKSCHKNNPKSSIEKKWGK